jgi:hypothetical protein
MSLGGGAIDWRHIQTATIRRTTTAYPPMRSLHQRRMTEGKDV